MNPILQQAIDLAESGIPVFPCLANKRPATANGFKDASLNAGAFRWGADNLVGVPTGEASGFDVLDIDPGNGGDDWLREHASRIPATRIHRTRSGGLHILFKHREGVRNSQSKIAPGVDVRGEGGYVVHWPCERDAPHADWPEWLFEAATATKTGDRPTGTAGEYQPITIESDNPVALLESILGRIRDAADGEKHVVLRDCAITLGGVLHAVGIGFDAAIDKLIEALPEAEDYEDARKTAVWGLTEGSKRPVVVEWTVGAAEEFGALVPFEAAPPAASLDELTEDATYLAFAEHEAGNFLYDHDECRWFTFVVSRGWTRDDDGEISRRVRSFVKAAREQRGKGPDTKAAAKIGFSTAVERACQTHARMTFTRERWDAEPFTLGVPGGWLDLTTGEMHDADRTRFVRRFTSVAPAPPGTVPTRWLRFLDQATGGDVDLQHWLQRFAGYLLTADMREEMLAFFYGAGGNGKGVFLHTLSAILADYAYQAPAELFKADSRASREYQVAALDGKRAIFVSETESGAALAESFVKELTGNEGKINARHPYGRPFELRVQAKLLIVGNHAPRLQGRSAAMERRMRVVPFNHRPATPNPKLKDNLAAEYPAVFRWMIDGCRAWQQHGLGTAAAIVAASENYFADQDSVALWVEERCGRNPAARVPLAALSLDFNAWLRQRGDRAVEAKALREALPRLSPEVEIRRTNLGLTVFGLALRSSPMSVSGLSL